MNDIFFKPHLSDDRSLLHFPYSREDLNHRPIFPTYIFDGGASLFVLDAFGTNNSDVLLQKILSGELYQYWYLDGEFRWDAVYQKFSRLHYTSEWEAHLWLNRLYVLLPLAQAYCRTKDTAYSKRWFDTLMSWSRANPYITYEDRPDDMVWRDMQVAWRTINIVHSVFLLGAGDALNAEQWQAVYDLIRLHANHLMKEGLGHARTHIVGNHNLQIGMALIMIGVLFSEFGNSEACIVTGRQIVKDNLEKSIYEDGVNNEDSMTYSHFIARLYLEAELLLTKNGFDGIPDCARKLQKQYAFLYQFASPAGKTLQIGDSYCMDAAADVEFVNQIYPLTFARKKQSIVYEDSRMAVIRNNRFDLYVDAMDMTQWHQHYGRPNFILFCDGELMVSDTGCINYDRYDIRCRMNAAMGHNVITCKELPLEWELEKTDVSETLSIDHFSDENDVQTLVISNRTAGKTGKFYKWTRTFRLSDDALEICDRITASEPMHFTSWLHVPCCRIGYYDHGCHVGNTANVKDVQPVDADRKTANFRRGEKMEIIKTATAFASDFLPCISQENRVDYCHVLTREFVGREFEEQTTITFESPV